MRAARGAVARLLRNGSRALSSGGSGSGSEPLTAEKVQRLQSFWLETEAARLVRESTTLFSGGSGSEPSTAEKVQRMRSFWLETEAARTGGESTTQIPAETAQGRSPPKPPALGRDVHPGGKDQGRQ